MLIIRVPGVAKLPEQQNNSGQLKMLFFPRYLMVTLDSTLILMLFLCQLRIFQWDRLIDSGIERMENFTQK